MKFLIVDDDEDSLVFLERILKSQGHDVSAFSSSISAFEDAQKSPPEMIISDILMPNMDGFQFCRKIKQTPKLKDIPFIFYTATYTEQIDRELALDLGVSRFLIKPLEAKELIKIIYEIFEEEKNPTEKSMLTKKYNQAQLDELNLKVISRKLSKKTQQLGDALVSKEKANLAKTNFLSHMSHELRTPLNAIIGFSELMVSEINGDLTDIYKDYSSIILTSGKDMLNTISNMFDLTLLDTGDIKVSTGRFRVTEVVDEVVERIKPSADSSKIKLSIVTDPLQNKANEDEWDLVSDISKIKKILINILSNSIKFSPKGNIKIEIISSENNIDIRVTDNGVGMSKEEIKVATQTFGPLEDGAYIKHNAGAGLGLPVSIGLVRVLGGKVDIKSKVGDGTVVNITLPREKSQKY